MFSQLLAKALASMIFFPYVCWASVFRRSARLTRVSLASIVCMLFILNAILSWLFGVSLKLDKKAFPDDAGNMLLVKASNVDPSAKGSSGMGREKIRSNVSVEKSQTLSHVLGEIGVSNKQIFSITNDPEVKKITINEGQVIRLLYSCDIQYKEAEQAGNLGAKGVFFPPRYRMHKDCVVHEMSIPIGAKILEYKYENGVGSMRVKKLSTKKVYRIVRGRILSSLYKDAMSSNVPARIISKLLKEYGYILDFQRDIHRDDVFSIVFEEIQSEEGNVIGNGDLLFADVVTSGNRHPIYLFKDEYYNEKGQSIKKTLLMTPVDGARISSPFGKRTHPILGYTREHKGIDFAAPTGTPVYSAGDGVVEFVGVKSGYGKFVTVRHNSDLKTNYAHLNGFGKIKTGSKVMQREVIGYVGSTGMATGPHLHFEMVLNGQKVNPKSKYFNDSKRLAQSDMPSFNRFKNDIDRAFRG